MGLAMARRPDATLRTRLLSRFPARRVLLKFIATGALVAAVQLGLVTLLAVLGMPVQLALALTFIVVLALHFTLNRQWVFVSERGYALRLSGQGARYLVVAATSYLGTALGIAVLHAVVGIPELAAFFVMSAVMACVSFVMLQFWIFRAAAVPRGGTS